MRKKIIKFASLLTIIGIFSSIGVVFAAKPMEVSSTLVMDAISLVDTKVAGNNILSERILIGSFTDGNFEGDVYREATILMNVKLNSANGPLVFPEVQVYTTSQSFVVSNAKVTVDGIVAVGTFEMVANGKNENVKWHISSSDMTIEGTGEPIKLHGNGIITIIGAIPPSGPPPPFYTLINGVIGQVSFS